MVQLVTQKQLRSVKKLPFCYACGNKFTEENRSTDDHIPPKSCFAKSDRTFPLQLPTHAHCNSSRNLTDEIIGQIISLKHGEPPSARDHKVEFTQFENKISSTPLEAITNANIHEEIWRWVRAFHAALYQEYLPFNNKYALETPFPTGRITSNCAEVESVKHQHIRFVETIKLNRIAGNLDLIHANNGKLKFECVWDQANNGSWLCIFALDLYFWKDLGDINNFIGRGCAGCYLAPSSKAPLLATTGTKLFAPLPNADPLDPFGK
jgi:hypothetical protein